MQIDKFTYHSDSELLEKYRKDHNTLWIGVLLDRYLHLIVGVCMKYLKNEEDARDFTQQICLEVLKTLPRHHITYFKSWLYQVAKNYCLMEFRKSGRIRTVPISGGEEEITNTESETAREEAEKTEYRENLLAHAMLQLNDAQQRCLDLFYLQNKTYQDVSEETGFTLLQVKSHIQNGKRNLRIILQKMEKTNEENQEKTNKFLSDPS